MANIDPTSSVGMLRLRVADYGDISLLPDSVYTSTLVAASGNIPAAAKTLAMYILGMLSHKTHRKLAMMEVWGSESFSNYKAYLLLVYTNPTFMDISPIPYSATADNPLADFQSDWNRNFSSGTQSQAMALSAELSPNDGSRLGPYAYSGAY